jgi:hypothetical protein
MDLLCVAFPVNGIPELPTSRSRRPHRIKRPVAPNFLAPLPDPVVVPTFPEWPYVLHHGAAHVALMPQQTQAQPWTQPRADYVPLPGTTMQYPQVDPKLLVPWSHVPTPTFLQVHSTPSPLQQSNAQRRQQFASLNVLSASSEMGDWRTNAGATSWGMANPSDGLGSTSLVEGDGDPFLVIDENTGPTSYVDADMDAVFVTPSIESTAGSALDGGGGGRPRTWRKWIASGRATTATTSIIWE